MISVNIENLSDNDLATCVDEFFKRVINSIRNSGIEQPIQLLVRTSQYDKETDYKIEHKALIGHDYGEHHTSTVNNLMTAAHNAAARWLEDKTQEPDTVRPMIAYQPEQTVVENEDVPF